MKKLCCDESLDICNDIKTRLEANGIACLVKNEGAEPLLGGAQPLVGPTLPEVWVLDDSQFEQARQIVDGDTAVSDDGTEPDEPPDA